MLAHEGENSPPWLPRAVTDTAEKQPGPGQKDSLSAEGEDPISDG